MQNVEELESCAEKIYQLGVALADNHSKCLMPNKAAGARARKDALALEKACKEYRRLSMEAFK